MEQKWQSSQDLLGPLSELKGHGFDALLQGLFEDLKVAGASFPGVYAEPGAGGPGEGLEGSGGAEGRQKHVAGVVWGWP